jgi:aspartate/tyrosine/aromatic aminotransferase
MISYLLEKHIYTTRTGDGVRIAICALTENEIKILANSLEEYQITCKSK